MKIRNGFFSIFEVGRDALRNHRLAAVEDGIPGGAAGRSLQEAWWKNPFGTDAWRRLRIIDATSFNFPL